MAGNVGACDGRGLGGLSNGAKLNAKADQLYSVPRDNAHKDNDSYEDTEPPPGTSILLAPVACRSVHFITVGGFNVHQCKSNVVFVLHKCH